MVKLMNVQLAIDAKCQHSIVIIFMSNTSEENVDTPEFLSRVHNQSLCRLFV